MGIGEERRNAGTDGDWVAQALLLVCSGFIQGWVNKAHISGGEKAIGKLTAVVFLANAIGYLLKVVDPCTR